MVFINLISVLRDFINEYRTFELGDIIHIFYKAGRSQGLTWKHVNLHIYVYVYIAPGCGLMMYISNSIPMISKFVYIYIYICIKFKRSK